MTVRDVRLKWPEAERLLATGDEIVVTRDARPVARILPYAAPRRRSRRRFDPADQVQWLQGFWKRQAPQRATDELLRRDRAE